MRLVEEKFLDPETSLGKVSVAFYKAEQDDWIGKAINIFTNFGKGKNDIGFSHTELVFHDIETEIEGTTMCFSSNFTDGVRWKEINIKPYNWVMVDVSEYIEFYNIDKNKMYNEMERLEGRGYDKIGILFHEFFPFSIENKKNWWCSEICAHLLGIKVKDDPNVLYNILLEKILIMKEEKLKK